MKINEWIPQAMRYLRKNSYYFTGVLMLVLGISIAVRTFQLLMPTVSLTGKNEDIPKKSRDTIYVNLVNGNYKGVIDDTNNINKNSGDFKPDKRRDDGSGNFAQDFKSQLLIGKATQMSPDQKSARFGNSTKKIPLWIYIISGIVLLGIITYSFFNYLPYLDVKLNHDRDPKMLAEAFVKMGNEIKELSNPRKIKRFSNKTRFQYHYLWKKDLLHDKEDVIKLLKIILAIEEKGVGFDFVEASTKIIGKDSPLLPYFLELNKDDNAL